MTVLPSIFSLKTMRSAFGKSTAPKPMIAFADPIFSNRSDKGKEQIASGERARLYLGDQVDVHELGRALAPLPNTRTEVQAIAKALVVDAQDVKFGTEATETAVKQARLDQYKVIYFATHALVAGDLEKFSNAKVEPAIVLTIPEKPSKLDDGLLQASEVSQLKLNAEWVVLSACNTASGDEVGSEALSGLARAFLYAGAESLIVSHWEVSDEATAKLMTTLFEVNAKNPTLSHGEALREAMLYMLNTATSDEEAHPRFWAPFIVVGEPAKRM
jgi:CHAT domain-containing protein